MPETRFHVKLLLLAVLAGCSSPMDLEGPKDLCAVRSVQSDLSAAEYLRSIDLEGIDDWFQGTNCLTILLLSPTLGIRSVYLERATGA